MSCNISPRATLDPVVYMHYVKVDVLRWDPRCWLSAGHVDRHRFRASVDHPLREVAATVTNQLRDPGVTIWQKFTCEWCGARQDMSEPNVLFTQGDCEECGETTDIEEAGCNFVMVMALSPKGAVDVAALVKEVRDDHGIQH